MPKVSIVILNWNGWKDTIECLESLYQINYPNYDVILVDNGSEDDSIKKIREYCQGKIRIQSDFFEYLDNNKPIRVFEYIYRYNILEDEKEYVENILSSEKLIIIKNDKNYGFTEGNNIAIRYILKSQNSDFILLLNNDTTVDKYFLDELIKEIENNVKIGIIGPKIYYYDKKDKIFSIGGKINPWTGRTPFIGFDELDKGQFENSIDVDYVSGCALLIRTNLIKEIGLLNKKYFSYYEETEWCIKAKKCGYSIICNPKSKIWHKIAATSKKSYFYLYYSTRNRFIFSSRNFNKLQFLFSSIFFFITYFPLTIIENMYKLDLNSLKIFFKAIYDGWNEI